MVREAARTLSRVASERSSGLRAAQLLQRAAAMVDEELADVRSRIARCTDEAPGSARLAADHLIGAGGKGVRPTLTLLCARAAGGRARSAVVPAVAAEMIHNATLLHDDVIDDGTVRRGRPTPRIVWGNTVSVLSGDLLFVRALGLMEEQGPPESTRELLATVALLVEGEVIQFDHRGRMDMTSDVYMRIVECKTASLFRWCARAGARAGGADPETIEALGRYGQHIGRAFQMSDDVLDLTADPDRLGKDLAADLAGGKVTLPVLFAIEQVPALAETLAQQPLQPAAVERAVEAIAASGAFQRTRSLMDHELDQGRKAIASVASRPERELLEAVARAIALRDR